MDYKYAFALMPKVLKQTLSHDLIVSRIGAQYVSLYRQYL